MLVMLVGEACARVVFLCSSCRKWLQVHWKNPRLPSWFECGCRIFFYIDVFFFSGSGEARCHYVHFSCLFAQVLCEATQCPEVKVRVAALQNLVKIMSLYYQYMHMYMTQALFAITINAMESEDDDVALQGIEFWSTVAEAEMDLALATAEARESGRVPTISSRHYCRGRLYRDHCAPPPPPPSLSLFLHRTLPRCES